MERRKEILRLLGEAKKPLSGTSLGHATGVSRQVIVQDIALLRTEGYSIISTARGYVLDAPKGVERLVKVRHTEAAVEDELNTIVDLGGSVLNVMVNHRAYGKVEAPLGVRNRREVQEFLCDLKSGKSSALLNLTSGYHFHRIAAESEAVLDEIVEALRSKNYLSELLPYEREGDIGEA